MKKILAIILSVMLIMSMGTVAFAAQLTDNKGAILSDDITVTITKKYVQVGEGTSPAETFTLETVGTPTVSNSTVAAADIPALGTITGAEFEAGDATAEGTEKDITIALPTYTAIGVYTYFLQEVAGTTGGVTYFGRQIKLVVTVVNDENTGKVRVAAVHTEDQTVADATKSDTFENEYITGNLNITKTVTGITGDDNEYFDFKVTLTAQEGKNNYNESYPVSGGSHEENATTIAIGSPATFKLKHGETLTIKGLPVGVDYKVEENQANQNGYTTTKEGDTGTIANGEQNASFTNQRGGVVDTGVFVDSLPYVIIIAFVVFGGVAMVIKRRKVEA